METVELAAQLQDRGVVGIDLSGNPSVGTWSTWVPALQRARELGLALTLHCGEVDNAEEVRQVHIATPNNLHCLMSACLCRQVAAMLAFRPERLGHAVTAAAEEGLMPALLTSRIPVELCLTSNVLSQSVSSYGAHHFADLWSAQHPVVLCTDDSGVFDTCLSREYAIAASAFKLTRHQLWCIAQSGFEHCFAPPAVRAALLERVRVLRAGEEKGLTP
jgi:adenosine deaminase